MASIPPLITCPNCGHEFHYEPVDPESTPMRNARVGKGLSLVDAARLMGMSDWALSRLERGIGNPKLSTLKAVAKFYGQPIEELFPEPADSEEDSNEDEEEMIIDGKIVYVPDSGERSSLDSSE